MDMNTNLPIIGSPSRTEIAARCHRRHFVSNIACYQPRWGKAASLAFGTVMHAGVAEWWRTHDAAQADVALRQEWFNETLTLDAQQKLTIELASAMLASYCADAGPAGEADDNGEWVSVAIEERVVLELSPLARLSFQLDRLMRNRLTDEHALVDTKTRSSWRRDLWQAQWGLSLQQKLYQYGVAKHYGITLDHHYIEGVLKSLPSEITYVQLPIWGESELAEIVDQFVSYCQRDAKLVARATLPGDTIDLDKLITLAITQTDHNPHDCRSYNVPCPMLDVCKAPHADRLGLFLQGFEYVEPIYLD